MKTKNTFLKHYRGNQIVIPSHCYLLLEVPRKESRAGEIDADKGYVAKCESSYNPLTASKEKTLENRSPTILVLPMLVDTSINYLIFLRAFPMIMGLN